MADPTSDTASDAERFAQQAEQGRVGALHELWDFLRTNKRWWLTPIVVMLVVVGALSILSASALAPMIYTLF
jgi:hypothetical protein